MNFEYLFCAELKNNNKNKIKEDADWSKQNKLATKPAIKAGTNSSPYYSFRRHRGEQFASRSGWPGGLAVTAAIAEGGCLGGLATAEGLRARWDANGLRVRSDGTRMARRDADDPAGRGWSGGTRMA